MLHFNVFNSVIKLSYPYLYFKTKNFHGIFNLFSLIFLHLLHSIKNGKLVAIQL